MIIIAMFLLFRTELKMAINNSTFIIYHTSNSKEIPSKAVRVRRLDYVIVCHALYVPIGWWYCYAV